MDSPPFEQIDVPRLLSLLFIEAKKKGRAWEANCPFGKHVDKHPSWSIREEPGTKRNGKHWCFSCHTGGTAIDLVMHVLGLSLGGANDFVAERSMRKVHHALNIRYEIGAPVIRRACKMPDGVYFEPLKDWVSSAQKYVRARGITDDQVDKWGIGYAIDGKLGGRFVIPTRDSSGKLLNWAARTYLGSEKRYLAASTEDRPDIDAVFGEQFWKPRKDSVLVVVEGAINGLAVERVTDENIFLAGLSGSHLEPGHALKLSTHPRVLILTDPDHAGDDAANKLIWMMGRHCNVKRLRLNEGEDPANVDPEYLRERLCEALRSLEPDA